MWKEVDNNGEQQNRVRSMHCLFYDNSSPTFQAEIADRGGHERGEKAPGGEMSHQKPHNQLSRTLVSLDRARKVEATE